MKDLNAAVDGLTFTLTTIYILETPYLLQKMSFSRNGYNTFCNIDRKLPTRTYAFILYVAFY